MSGVSLLGKTMGGLAETAGKTLSSFFANTLGKGTSPEENSQRMNTKPIDEYEGADTTLLEDYLDNSLTPTRQTALMDVSPFGRNAKKSQIETEVLMHRRTTQVIATKSAAME